MTGKAPYGSKNYYIALAIVGAIVAALLFFGLQMLTIPKIFMLTQRPYSLIPYEGPVLVFLAVLLAWFREWAAQKLLWAFLEIHRWISGLVMAAVVASEGFMHMFAIPHMEGWWIPLLSGGMAATLGAWFHKHKKELPPQEAEHG